MAGVTCGQERGGKRDKPFSSAHLSKRFQYTSIREKCQVPQGYFMKGRPCKTVALWVFMDRPCPSFVYGEGYSGKSTFCLVIIGIIDALHNKFTAVNLIRQRVPSLAFNFSCRQFVDNSFFRRLTAFRGKLQAVSRKFSVDYSRNHRGHFERNAFQVQMTMTVSPSGTAISLPSASLPQ